MKHALVALFFLPAALAQAQGVYRCGNSFSEQPCGPDAKVLQAPPVKLSSIRKLPDTPPADSVIEANKQTCAAAVRAAMKDPDAARVGAARRSGADVDYFNGRAFHVVTYFVNANGKNSYGGYTGDKLHICSFDPGETRLIRTAEIGPAVR